MPFSKSQKREHYRKGGRKVKAAVVCSCGTPVEPFSTDLVACPKCKREYLIKRRANKAQLWPVKPEMYEDDGWVMAVEKLLTQGGA